MLAALLASCLVSTPLADTTAAYQVTMLRAAPGRLLELIDGIKARLPVYDAASVHRPVLLRHAQGDQWDLAVVLPIGSIAERFGAERAARWSAALKRTGFDDTRFARLLDEGVSWREDLYVDGPPVAALDSAVAQSGYFHLEIFQALAGKRDSLMAERHMENDFAARVGRPTTLIFRKITGSSWDAFTLGFYRDLRHYAEPAAVSAEAEDAAARAAGFESRNHIGAHLRRFIASHHDTIGPIVK